MVRKRLSKEFSSLSEIESPTKFAKVHSVVIDLTQMDNGEYPFEGRIADDQRVCKFLDSKRDSSSNWLHRKT